METAMSTEQIARIADSKLGCPYIYGTWGKRVCSKSLRVQYANYRPSKRAITYKRCQQLRDSDVKSSCDGCKYKGMLAFDCRGFVHWVLEQAGIEITGQGVGTQWSGKQWSEKGDIAAMPDLIAAVFIKSGGKWTHVGLHVGGGRIVHCSGEVKSEMLGAGRKWTHYAIPEGLYTADEIKRAHDERGIFMRTLKKGMQGEDVRALQDLLIGLGYDLGPKGADGIFGAMTEAAVSEFQKKNGLTVDGIAGPDTIKKLLGISGTEDADPDEQEGIPQPSDPMAYGDHVLVPREDLYAALKIVRELCGRMEAWIE